MLIELDKLRNKEQRLRVAWLKDAAHAVSGHLVEGNILSKEMKKLWDCCFQVQRVDGEEVQVKYMQQLENDLYAWPTVDDISIEPTNSVKRDMGQPMPVLIGQRLRFKFN